MFNKSNHESGMGMIPTPKSGKTNLSNDGSPIISHNDMMCTMDIMYIPGTHATYKCRLPELISRNFYVAQN